MLRVDCSPAVLPVVPEQHRALPHACPRCRKWSKRVRGHKLLKYNPGFVLRAVSWCMSSLLPSNHSLLIHSRKTRAGRLPAEAPNVLPAPVADGAAASLAQAVPGCADGNY